LPVEVAAFAILPVEVAALAILPVEVAALVQPIELPSSPVFTINF
jgi:hypothetical protein